MLLNCIIPKAGMQQEDIRVTGERKQEAMAWKCAEQSYGEEGRW
jgi:hypothetical protein